MSAVIRTVTLSFIIAACSADVVTDYDVQLNYSKFQTYQFAPHSGNHIITLDSARVIKAITSELQNKGLKYSDDTADLTVKHYILHQSDFRSYGTSVGFGYGHRNLGVAFSSPSQFREYRYGKLVVELIENNSNNIIWRAVSKRKLTETMTPKSRDEFIDKQISEMFKGYPPKTN